MSTTFTDATFQDEVLNFKGVVLVDFWAEWCTPCKMIAPAVHSIAEKYTADKTIKIGELNVDDNQETAMKYNVMSIPTLLIFKDGAVVDTIVGLRPESDIEARLLANMK
jgi:thioredoxin 1